jgi:hypothetical protein
MKPQMNIKSNEQRCLCTHVLIRVFVPWCGKIVFSSFLHAAGCADYLPARWCFIPLLVGDVGQSGTKPFEQFPMLYLGLAAQVPVKLHQERGGVAPGAVKNHDKKARWGYPLWAAMINPAINQPGDCGPERARDRDGRTLGRRGGGAEDHW